MRVRTFFVFFLWKLIRSGKLNKHTPRMNFNLHKYSLYSYSLVVNVMSAVNLEKTKMNQFFRNNCAENMECRNWPFDWNCRIINSSQYFRYLDDSGQCIQSISLIKLIMRNCISCLLSVERNHYRKLHNHNEPTKIQNGAVEILSGDARGKLHVIQIWTIQF